MRYNMTKATQSWVQMLLYLCVLASCTSHKVLSLFNIYSRDVLRQKLQSQICSDTLCTYSVCASDEFNIYIRMC